MKKTLLILVLAMFSVSSFAQKYDGLSYSELISKSKKARTMGTIFVSVGPVIAVGGVGTLIYGLLGKNDPSLYDNGSSSSSYSPYYGSYYPTTNNNIKKNYNNEIIIGAVGTAVGIAVAVYSTHFFSKAKKMKKLARGMKLKTTTDNIRILGIGNTFAYMPAKQMKFTLSIPLGR
jgi:hypothetical protein